MSHQLKQEYLKSIRERYENSSHSKKSLILDEFCAVCDYSRKYAIAILNRKAEPFERKPRGRQVRYGLDVVYHLVRLWRALGTPGSTKFRAALPEWIPYDEDKRVQEDPELYGKILSVSRPQLDRLLRPYRIGAVKGISSTRPGEGRIKGLIPIQAKDWNITKPGEQVQSDTVAHCGNSLSGKFANSLTLTDIHSTWTENRALWGKGAHTVVAALRSIESSLPFTLLGFKSDSGSEFINYEVLDYLKNNRPNGPVNVTRSRPYKKDDNCYVEQKNFTHVRELFGYTRMDEEEWVVLMNEIYTDLWNPLQNFFLPTQKLLRKTRIGSRIKKEYEKAQTPYQRLMDSPSLTEEQKDSLRERKRKLNPFHLQNKLKLKLMELEELIRKRNTGLIAA